VLITNEIEATLVARFKDVLPLKIKFWNFQRAWGIFLSPLVPLCLAAFTYSLIALQESPWGFILFIVGAVGGIVSAVATINGFITLGNEKVRMTLDTDGLSVRDARDRYSTAKYIPSFLQIAAKLKKAERVKLKSKDDRKSLKVLEEFNQDIRHKQAEKDVEKEIAKLQPRSVHDTRTVNQERDLAHSE